MPSWSAYPANAAGWRRPAALIATAGPGLAGTVVVARDSLALGSSPGAEIPMVAGLFAAPLAAYLLVRGVMVGDRRLMWSLAAASLPLYLSALWVVARALAGAHASSAVASALGGACLISGFLHLGLSVGAGMLAGADRVTPSLPRALTFALTTLPTLIALGWALDRLPVALRVSGPPVLVFLAAIYLPWVTRAFDRAWSSRVAVVSAVAFFAGTALISLFCGLFAVLRAPGGAGMAVDAVAAALRVFVPLLALGPVAGLVVGIRLLHGPMPGARTAMQAGFGLAICTVPFVLHALALSRG